MKLKSNIDNNYQEKVNAQEFSKKIQDEPILCPHCKRTASNGVRCKGICVSDSDY